MRRLLKMMFKLGAVAGAVVIAIRGLKLFEGSPETVGDEGFSFATDGAESDDPFAIDESTLGGDVSPELLERLVCPLDKGPLDLVDGQWLVNPRNGYRYPISDGIPVMLIEVGERYKEPSPMAEVGSESETEPESGDADSPDGSA